MRETVALDEAIILKRLRNGMPVAEWVATESEIAELFSVSGDGHVFTLASRLPIEFEGQPWDAAHTILVRDDGSGIMRFVDHGNHMDQGDHMVNEETEGTH